MEKTPKCFISYSWDSDSHKDWVLSLARDLVSNGIDTRLDQWDLRLGDQIPRYMETSVRESDFVLLICTPTFASKANSGEGGVGYESSIVTGQIFVDVASDRKFIPVLRDGDGKTALPSYLKTKAYIDFRDDSHYPENLESLLRNLYGMPKIMKPTLGEKPFFISNPEESITDFLKSNYKTLATSQNPALVIFLLDVSGSMGEPFESTTRVDAISKALQKIAVRMVMRSTKGSLIAPRYRIGMFAYSSSVFDLLGGIKTIDELAKMGVPILTTLDMTDTAQAFSEIEKLLVRELPKMQNCPAPLICHITDGEYNGANPFPVMKRIMDLSVNDGNVLIENIYMKQDILHTRIDKLKEWEGCQTEHQLKDEYAKALFRHSSFLPESYRSIIKEFGYSIKPTSRLFFPGSTTELLELAFSMTASD